MAGAGRTPAATASVTSSASVAAPGRDPRVVAVDEQLDRVVVGIRLGCRASRVEVLPHLDDLRAERAHPLDLARGWRGAR